MEWVIFQSKTSFDVNDQRENGKEPIVGTVKIRLKTGPQAIKCFMGYGWCSLNKGFDVGGDDGKGSNRRYKENEKSKVLTVTGGDLPMLDYTVESLVSTVPVGIRLRRHLLGEVLRRIRLDGDRPERPREGLSLGQGRVRRRQGGDRR